MSDFTVKIVGDATTGFKFQITKIDGSIVIYPPDTKIFAAQIVAEAFTINSRNEEGNATSLRAAH